jgi:type II secretory pathway component PulL
MDFNGRFIFSFKDGSGFSINEIDSEGYLSLLKRENPDYNPRCMSENKMLRDAFPKSRNEEKSALADLHGHFMSEQQLNFPNIFQKRLSFRSIYRRFDLSSNQLGLSLILILSLVALPVINLSIMHSYEGEYREKIKRTFSSINPNSRRVINPRAQMDELLSNQITSQPSNIDLSAFTYLSALNLEDISRTSIDFEKATIELEFNGIGQMKYTLIERLIEEFGLSILTNDLVTVDSKVSGILKLEYPNE